LNEGIHIINQQFVLTKKVGKEDSGKMLREFLTNKSGLSRRAITAIKKGGDFLVNRQSVTVRYMITEGDVVDIIFPKEEASPGLIPESVPLDIIYEEDAFLVINKPADLQTVPSIRNWIKSVANGVVYYLQNNGLAATAHMVTRLDRDTSGLVLVAKHGFLHEYFTRMRKNGDLTREYIAIIHGHLSKKEGTIDAPIGRKDGSIIERCVRPDGKPAITHYKVLEETSDNSFVSVVLETGRTHQIRVHFSNLGHPLVGDDLYGGKKEAIARQALHCHKLHLYHPITLAPMTFTAPLPEDMASLVRK
jgi:23S rRNA pseudouridine1911/1915/1917 synthase